jgi:hypothetical protein
MRTPLPDREVMDLEVGGENWEKFVHWLYFFNVHPITSIMNDNLSVNEIKCQRAMEGWQMGYMIEEGIYLYPDPDSMFPCSMRPAEAREYMAAGPGEFGG